MQITKFTVTFYHWAAILKIKDGGGGHCEKSQYLRNGRIDFDKIWHGVVPHP